MALMFIFLFGLIVFGDAAFVDTLGKCSLKDEECTKSLINNALNEISSTGIPELDIPPVDPIALKNVSVTVLGLVDITLLEGQAKGVKTCKFSSIKIDLEKEIGGYEFTCDIDIEGKYKVFSESPLIKNLLGGTTVHGEGNGKVQLEKLQISMKFPVYAQKRDDGEIYMKCDYSKIKYDYQILGKTKFYADNLFLGEQEASKLVTTFLNENWKFVMDTFGRSFFDKAMDIFYSYTSKFFGTVPAKHYLTDDFTSIAKP
uniref:Juvenile hormone binding protein n=1 Tax=Bombyx mori TaxID=7091 RepID=C6KYM1_BOMMO|nr:juvenile hormone binding protein [Bombyx mori]